MRCIQTSATKHPQRNITVPLMWSSQSWPQIPIQSSRWPQRQCSGTPKNKSDFVLKCTCESVWIISLQVQCTVCVRILRSSGESVLHCGKWNTDVLVTHIQPYIFTRFHVEVSLVLNSSPLCLEWILISGDLGDSLGTFFPRLHVSQWRFDSRFQSL